MENGFYVVKGVSDSTREKRTVVFVKDGEVFFLGWDITSRVEEAINEGMKVIRKVNLYEEV